jgi:hypothetical protein
MIPAAGNPLRRNIGSIGKRGARASGRPALASQSRRDANFLARYFDSGIFCGSAPGARFGPRTPADISPGDREPASLEVSSSGRGRVLDPEDALGVRMSDLGSLNF